MKYLKQSESVEGIKAEGLAQLKRYAESPRFREKKDLKKALLIFRGKDECFIFQE